MKVKTNILYNKALCAIHRMNMNTRNRSQLRSLNICVQAATTCLGDMVYVFEESIEGGRLCRDRWMRTSVHSSDFFFSASILCWLLLEKQRNDGLECPFVDENKHQVMNNLLKAQQICDGKLVNLNSTPMMFVYGADCEIRSGSVLSRGEAGLESAEVHPG